MSEAAAVLEALEGEGVETSLIVRVDQILNGDAECHCGEPAVLVVVSEPDGDPGPTCLAHAREWIDHTVSFTYQLFSPKEGA